MAFAVDVAATLLTAAVLSFISTCLFSNSFIFAGYQSFNDRRHKKCITNTYLYIIQKDSNDSAPTTATIILL